MGTTWRILANGIREALKENFADREIGLREIIWWCKVAMNKQKGDRMEKDGVVTGKDVVFFGGVTVNTYPSNAGSLLHNKKYVDLPNVIISMEYDRGIDYISYQLPSNMQIDTPLYFSRMTLQQIEMVKKSPFEKPTYKNPAYVLLNNTIVLFGIENLPIDKIDLNLIVAENPDIRETTWDEEVIASEEDILAVVQTVLQLGNWVLLTPKERVVEGADLRNVRYDRSTLQLGNQQQPQPQQTEQ